MDLLKFYYGLDYKYTILVLLLNNYYLSNYSKNKFNSKILVVGDSEKNLMSEYERFFKVIDSLCIEDINTLIKFQSPKNKKVSYLFNKFKDNQISNEKIIDDLKRLYTRDSSMYFDDFRVEYKNTKDEKNIIFIQLDDIEDLYDSYMVRDLYISYFISDSEIKLGKHNFLVGRISLLVRVLRKTGQITKRLLNNNLLEDKDFKLNIHFKGDFDTMCSLEDSLRNTLFEDDEVEDD